jgi:phenylacetate-CoA ligase
MSVRKILAKCIVISIRNRNSRFRKNLKSIEKSQWFTYEEIRRIQYNKLQKLLNYSYSNIPYYKELFNKEKINVSDIKSLDDLRKIPRLSKKIIRENIDNMLSSLMDKSTLIKLTTSGSTGEPVTVFRNINAQNIHTAAGWRFRKWAGHDIGDKYARIWGESVPVKNKSVIISFIKSQIRQILDNITEPIERLNANDTISNSLMENFFLRIKRKKIRLLIGYASSVYFFAQFMNKHHSGEMKFKSVRTISEMLHKYQRDLVEKVFDCKVFDTYGNRENGLIAAECSSHKGYHINAENLYLEILDKSGKPVSPGSTGEIAVTDLNNYAMPLIRYLTGDIGSLSPITCTCGRGLPLIEKIEGRILDALFTSNGSSINGLVFSGFFINYSDGIEKYQFIQNLKGEADLFLKLSKPFTKDQFELFQKNLTTYLNNRLLIKYHIVDEIPLQKSGKHKFIISNIKTR